MKLVIVSGRSGSGKSTALHVLEDVGFYCIDNLPLSLLIPLSGEILSNARSDRPTDHLAVSIDARNLCNDFSSFLELREQLSRQQIQVEVIYLDADASALLKRFHSTRRKHPLSGASTSLKEAIENEALLLSPLAEAADLKIDTSNLGMYQLRDLIKERVAGHRAQQLSILIQSFGFKNGVPTDADFVFDVRCLPNPYWDASLRKYTGQDDPVIKFLENHPESGKMLGEIADFLNRWLPSFQHSNRTYMTIAIGCTGGQHRSVYISEKLRTLVTGNNEIQVRHRDLPEGVRKR